MKAIAVFPRQPGSVHLAELPKPSLSEVPGGRGVLIRVLRCGVDGTDKEINAGDYGAPPSGCDFLVLGHENFGQVEAVGENVTEVAPGDYVVATVRRPGMSLYDAIGTSDMTTDDSYFEHGINLLHGFLTEYSVEDADFIVSKFFEHFVSIVDAMNTLGGMGLWDEQDGFYYDQLHVDGEHISLKVRSMVGLIPLFAVEILEEDVMAKLPGFRRRMQWFLENRPDLGRNISYMACSGDAADSHRLLAIPSQERLERVLRYLLDETEFLSPYGIRAVSRIHRERPYAFRVGDQEHRVDYDPGESTTGLFGGNSNWRGPIWFPVNYLLVEALQRYHHFYGDGLRVECPTGSGVFMNLAQVSQELARRLASLFLPDGRGRRPCHGEDERYAGDPHWRDLVLFHEYFHGDTGRGVGASHQTGWTALAVRCLEDLAAERREKKTAGKAAPRPARRPAPGTAEVRSAVNPVG